MLSHEFYMIVIKKEEGYPDQFVGVTEIQTAFPTDQEIEAAIIEYSGTHATIEKQYKLEV